MLDDLIEERATDDPARHRQRLDTLLSRYRQLLVSIDETSQYCAILIPAKMIHENSSQLHTALVNITNAPIHFHDLGDVRTALQGQMKVCDVLESLSQQVHELVTRGNELIRQPLVPKYVQQDVQNIQKLYNDKVQTAHDFLGKFKVREQKSFKDKRGLLFCSIYLNFGNDLMRINVGTTNKPND